ncbi:MAG TPA: hypothetical protein VN780_06235 [Candidatus Eisenbacteria bacterium]|nr:hypothetical protein [Candidatus Eisenbacteria bacterium]
MGGEATNQRAYKFHVIDAFFVRVGGAASVGPTAVQAIGIDREEAVSVRDLVKMGQIGGLVAGSEATMECEHESGGLARIVGCGHVQFVGALAAIDGERALGVRVSFRGEGQCGQQHG